MDRIVRLSLDRQRHVSQRARESSVDRTVHLSLDNEIHFSQRARESSVDYTVRLSLDRERNISQRKKETPEDIQLRLRNDRIRHRNLRKIIQNNSSTSQNINRWSNKELPAMKYDSTIDYRNDPAISIGSPTIVYEYCSALKWKDESNGICCSNGKIKLDDIVVPPLKLLIDGNHLKHTEFLRIIRNIRRMTSFKSQRVVEHGFMQNLRSRFNTLQVVFFHIYLITINIYRFI